MIAWYHSEHPYDVYEPTFPCFVTEGPFNWNFKVMFKWYLIGNVTFLTASSERGCQWTSDQIPRLGFVALADGEKLCWRQPPLDQS